MKKLFTLIVITLMVMGVHAQVFKSIIIDSTGNSSISEMKQYFFSIVFTASDGTNGNELWRTDGTQNGTYMVYDIYPGPGSSQPMEYTDYLGKIYFTANDSVHGKELWVSDGNQDGTRLVKDIEPGPFGSNPNEFVVVNGKLLFSAWDSTFNGSLYAFDGNPDSLKVISTISVDLDRSVVFNNKLIFQGSDSLGDEPWITDGTAAGTYMLKNISPSFNSSEPRAFTVFNGKVYFAARTSAEGQEIWVTDGTPGGTQLFKDLYPGASSSNPGSLRVLGNKLLFIAEDATNGKELWVSDGTAGNTQVLKNIATGSAGSNPASPYVFGNTLYFFANDDTHGTELWKTDGTAPNTVMVKDINTATTTSMAPHFMIGLNGQLCFTTEAAPGDNQLFVTNGTSTGTSKQTPAGAVNTNALAFPKMSGFMQLPGNVFFGADYLSGSTRLWSFGNGLVGIEDGPADLHLQVFPNPANHVLNIVADGLQQGDSVSVFNVAGQVLYSYLLTGATPGIQIPLANVSAGVYFLKIETTAGAVTSKFIVAE